MKRYPRMGEMYSTTTPPGKERDAIEPPSFSLIMCTVDRTDEPRQFLQSLAAQTYRNFEIFVVDQNDDDRIRRVVAEFDGVLPIILLDSPRGLSRARNTALARVKGDVVAFPDDDCTYPEGLLAGVAMWFAKAEHWQGLSIRRTDRYEPRTSSLAPLRLDRSNIWGRVPSISLFLKRNLVVSVGSFDESLGAGAGTPWGAGEDSDFVLRALAQGALLIHDPSLQVIHPPPLRFSGATGRRRARSYARGLGRVLRKNGLPIWMVAGGCILSATRAMTAALHGNVCEATWHLQTLVGRIEGWLARPAPLSADGAGDAPASGMRHGD